MVACLPPQEAWLNRDVRTGSLQAHVLGVGFLVWGGSSLEWRFQFGTILFGAVGSVRMHSVWHSDFSLGYLCGALA